MNLSGLTSLGKVAGIGGIALGAMVLVLHEVIARALPGIPYAYAQSVVQLIVVGSFGIGGLGIIAWSVATLVARQGASTRGSQSPAIVARGNVEIAFGTSGAAGAKAQARGRAQPGSAPAGNVQTQGDQSPAVISGGNARFQYGSEPPEGTAPASAGRSRRKQAR